MMMTTTGAAVLELARERGLVDPGPQGLGRVARFSGVWVRGGSGGCRVLVLRFC